MLIVHTYLLTEFSVCISAVLKFMILFCMAEKKILLLIMLNSAKNNVFVVYTHPHKTQIDVSRQVTVGGHSSSTTSNI